MILVNRNEKKRRKIMKCDCGNEVGRELKEKIIINGGNLYE